MTKILSLMSATPHHRIILPYDNMTSTFHYIKMQSLTNIKQMNAIHGEVDVPQRNELVVDEEGSQNISEKG